MTPSDPATGIGELRATPLIAVHCVAFGVKDVRIVYPHQLMPPSGVIDSEMLSRQLGDSDLVLMGSQITNPITKEALRLLSKASTEEGWLTESAGTCPTEERAFATNHWVRYRKGEQLETKYGANGPRHPLKMTEDFGIFVVRKNCFSRTPDSTARIFIFYGAHTHGTQAATDLFFSVQGAAQIAKRFGSIPSRGWNVELDGLVSLIPVPKEHPKEAMECFLDNHDRQITVIKSREANLEGITVVNPVIGSVVRQVSAYTKFGFIRSTLFRCWSYFAALVATWGLTQSNWTLAIAGTMLFVIQVVANKRNA